MSSGWKRTQTQTVIRDLEAWVQQLYEDHGVRLQLSMCLVLPSDGIEHAVWLEAYKTLPNGRRDVLHTDWVHLSDTQSGAIEKGVLLMASKLLLTLENDKARAEAQLSLWT